MLKYKLKNWKGQIWNLPIKQSSFVAVKTGFKEFYALMERSFREYKATQNSEKPMMMKYAGYATLRYYYEFTAIEGLKGLSPRHLKEFLSDYVSSHST